MLTPRPFKSYASKLALLYALIFSISTLILFYFLYAFTTNYMQQQLEDGVNSEIDGLAEHYDKEGISGLERVILYRVERHGKADNTIYLLVNHNTVPIVGNILKWPSEAREKGKWIEFSLGSDNPNESSYLAQAKIFKLPRPGDPQRPYGLLVGKIVQPLVDIKQSILTALGWGLLVMILLSALGGTFLGRKAAQKIARINRTTTSIMSGNMSERVPLSRKADDLDQVAANLNVMLDRIETLMEDIRRVSDNIAHDLRTPLSRLRYRLEDALTKTTPESEVTESLEQSIREADSLLATFNALLRIAKIEAGQVEAGFTDIEISVLLKDIVEFYEPLAEEKEQTVVASLEPDVTSYGDRNLLFQAFANIVENAIKYTPEQGTISITLNRSDDHVTVVITDSGPGIPESEMEGVFVRFHRLDQSRNSPGSGLGLSMAKAIITLHRGTITPQDNEPGLRMVIRIPVSATRAGLPDTDV
ncbi:MAG: HAMP domain-containing protein [Gammaproteobacteria bacterium]|nr:HAMP domain-containing protein [Gammaproteobacteria bacterium]MYD76403.1 HAMP domain-containing protein [Gammaproteobacteria bacterium]MYJ52816.1 HAMP domain-containing protein [Gammaproteobacteria bacterium]